MKDVKELQQSKGSKVRRQVPPSPTVSFCAFHRLVSHVWQPPAVQGGRCAGAPGEGACVSTRAACVRTTHLFDSLVASNARLVPRSPLTAPIQVCDPDSEPGEWITKLDMVEDGSRIKLVAQPGPGKCGVECRTVARACVDVLGDSDTDLSEALYAKMSSSGGGLTRGWLEPLLCHSLSKACAAPPPRVPATRPRGPGFEAKSAQDVEMDKLMRSMSGIPGMPGMSMYSRDDLAGLSEGMGEGDDDDDDVAPAQATRNAPQKAAAKDSGKKGATTAAGAVSAGLGEVATLVGNTLDSAVEKGANAVAGAWRWAEERFGKGRGAAGGEADL